METFLGRRLGLILLTAVAPAAWGTTYIVTEKFLPPDRPLFAALVRALPIGLMLLAWRRQLPRGDWWWKATVLGLFNIGLFFPLIFVSAYYLPGGLAATIQATSPLAVMAIAWLIIGERAAAARIAAAVIGLAGVTLLVLKSPDGVTALGLAGAFGSVAVSALGFVLIKRWTPPVDMITLVSWQLVVGGIALLPVALLVEGAPPAVDLSALLGYAWIAIIGTGLAYVCWFTGLRAMPAGSVSLIGLVNPVVGTALGVAFAHEVFGPVQALGVLLVLGGVVLGQRVGRRRARGWSTRDTRGPGRRTDDDNEDVKAGETERAKTADFRFRDIALAAYGPSVVNAIGHGAVMPILALRALQLGADVPTAALVVAMLGVGSLLASLPAGAMVARIGERRALTIVGSLDAVAMAFAALTDSVLSLGLAVLLSGMTWTVFLMSRQGFMIDAVPTAYRARAMSGLGGSMRVGVLIGPLLGAGLIAIGNLTWVFWLAAVMSLSSALLARSMTDFGSEHRAITTHLSVFSVLAAHRRILLTLGVAVVIIAASRSLRIGLLPLWAESVGLSASTTSLIFAAAAAVDIAFFFPGGWLMDHHGRFVVAVPVVATTAIGCLLLPLATTAITVGAVMMLMAVGNGLGSGIVMTLGADAAPVEGRAQFLGGWRLCGDVGGSGGALLVSAVAAAAPLAAACLVMGAGAAVGTVWVGYFTRRVDRPISR